MTLGAGKIMIAKDITPEFNVFITPSQLFGFTRKGSATTPEAIANVSGGVGPYTYSWATDNFRVSATNEDEEKTKFTASGINEQILATATVTVIDTGNGNAEKTATADLTFDFGVFA